MQASEATKQCEELRAELSAIQARFATANRRATEVANAAPRPLPPSLALAKAPAQASVTSSPDAAVEVHSETRDSPQSEHPRNNSIADGAQAVEPELEESLGNGAGTLLDEFVAEAAAYRCASRSIPENHCAVPAAVERNQTLSYGRTEAEAAQAEVATLRKKLESLELYATHVASRI